MSKIVDEIIKSPDGQRAVTAADSVLKNAKVLEREEITCENPLVVPKTAVKQALEVLTSSDADDPLVRISDIKRVLEYEFDGTHNSFFAVRAIKDDLAKRS